MDDDDKGKFVGMQIIRVDSLSDLLDDIDAKDDYNAISSVVKEYLGLVGVNTLNEVLKKIFTAGLMVGLQITKKDPSWEDQVYNGECSKCGARDSFIINGTNKCIECSIDL